MEKVDSSNGKIASHVTAYPGRPAIASHAIPWCWQHRTRRRHPKGNATPGDFAARCRVRFQRQGENDIGCVEGTAPKGESLTHKKKSHPLLGTHTTPAIPVGGEDGCRRRTETVSPISNDIRSSPTSSGPIGLARLGDHVVDRRRRNPLAAELDDVGVGGELRLRLREHTAAVVRRRVMADDALDVGFLHQLRPRASPPRAPGGRHPCRT